MSANARKASNFPRMPVTAWVIALILALAAPSLAFVAVLLFQSDAISKRQLEARAEEGVAAISQTLDRELRSMITNLSVFASSGWIESEEYDRLHSRASEALRGSDTYLLAVDADMQQVLNTRVQWGTPLNPTSDPASIREAIVRGEAWVSNVFFGRTAQRDVFNVILPLLSGESRVVALILARDAEPLSKIFQDSLPPPGWTYAVLDRQNKLVTGRAPDASAAIDFPALCGTTDGLHVEKAGDIEYSAASRAMAPWGWRVCVWTSSDQADAGVTQRWRNFTILALIIVAVTILSGAALGQMLARAIRRAATVGKALDAGGAVPETRSIVREVDDVLGTLTRAARRRLQHAEEQAILLRETSHRAKNQIAIATALARLSARSAQSVDQLRDDIVARLVALGQSIDMMSKSPSGAMAVQDLVTAQLQPFAAGHGDRLELEGPSVEVSPTTAQALGLVIHEMATNAAKYGAWSNPEGRVRISWVIGAEGGLVLTWSERGGPPPKPQERTGFGSSLIELMIERQLGGKIARDYPATGLVATFTLKPEGPTW